MKKKQTKFVLFKKNSIKIVNSFRKFVKRAFFRFCYGFRSFNKKSLNAIYLQAKSLLFLTKTKRFKDIFKILIN